MRKSITTTLAVVFSLVGLGCGNADSPSGSEWAFAGADATHVGSSGPPRINGNRCLDSVRFKGWSWF